MLRLGCCITDPPLTLAHGYPQGATISAAILSCFSHPAICSSSSLSICIPPRKITMATSTSFSSVTSGIWNALPNHLSSVPSLPVLEELSNIIHSCLLTLTVVQNLIWSNQLNVSALRDTVPTTAIAQPANTMPPI